jgi:hypothetical protein
MILHPIFEPVTSHTEDIVFTSSTKTLFVFLLKTQFQQSNWKSKKSQSLLAKNYRMAVVISCLLKHMMKFASGKRCIILDCFANYKGLKFNLLREVICFCIIHSQRKVNLLPCITNWLYQGTSKIYILQRRCADIGVYHMLYCFY